MCLQIIYSIYMWKQDLAFNNQQWLICHELKPNQTNTLLALFPGPLCPGMVVSISSPSIVQADFLITGCIIPKAPPSEKRSITFLLGILMVLDMLLNQKTKQE